MRRDAKVRRRSRGQRFADFRGTQHSQVPAHNAEHLQMLRYETGQFYKVHSSSTLYLVVHHDRPKSNPNPNPNPSPNPNPNLAPRPGAP